jgi:hypothetical protein
MMATRYLMPALVASPRRAAVPMRASRAVVATVEPHRVGIAVLKMLAALDNGRLGRGVDAVFVAAARTLPVLTPAASARGEAAQERIYERIAAQPQGSRVALLLAIVHELMATAPLSRDLDAACPWRDVLRALGAAQTAAGVEITEAHERAAAAIVAAVAL